MPLLGSLLSKGLKLTHLIEQDRKDSYEYQRKELKRLIKTARNTQFGKKYNFSEILKSFCLIFLFINKINKAIPATTGINHGQIVFEGNA